MLRDISSSVGLPPTQQPTYGKNEIKDDYSQVPLSRQKSKSREIIRNFQKNSSDFINSQAVAGKTPQKILGEIKFRKQFFDRYSQVSADIQIEILSKTKIFQTRFLFLANFDFSSKSRFFVKKVDFSSKSRVVAKVSIFRQKVYFSPKVQFLFIFLYF